MSRYGSYTSGSSYAAPSSYPYPPPRSRASSTYQSSSHAQPAFTNTYGPTFRPVNYDGRGSSMPYTHYQRPSATWGEVDYQGDSYNRGRLANGRSSYYRAHSPGGRHESEASMYSREPLRRSYSSRRESSGYLADREGLSSRRYAPYSGGDRPSEAAAAMSRGRQASTARSNYDYPSYGADPYGRRPALSSDPLRSSSRSYVDDYGRRAAVSRPPLRDYDRLSMSSRRPPSGGRRPSSSRIEDYYSYF
ncbi:hypothetical protein LTR15_008030 [Elasticomyces elasticus]|nr:hypothetical protein LTR15_008030 [Elasticomyces elasticus]